MDSEAIEREDRLARYVLTGLIITVCAWALPLMWSLRRGRLPPWWEVSLWVWWLPAAVDTSSPRYLLQG